jgi:hypothetical protein
MSKRDTIYVALLDEGIDVWRPVEAQRLSPDMYLIVDKDYIRAPRDGSRARDRRALPQGEPRRPPASGRDGRGPPVRDWLGERRNSAARRIRLDGVDQEVGRRPGRLRSGILVASS